ncbi:RRT15 protein, partial [Acromyrmex charruanus]
MRTEHRDQVSFCSFALREVSVLAELALGHLRYSLTDVLLQSNSPPGSVLESNHVGVSSAIGRGLTPL